MRHQISDITVPRGCEDVVYLVDGPFALFLAYAVEPSVNGFADELRTACQLACLLEFAGLRHLPA